MAKFENGDSDGRIDYPIAGQYDTEPDVLALQNQEADERMRALALGKLTGIAGEQVSADTDSAA